jgi:hypothetical protein
MYKRSAVTHSVASLVTAALTAITSWKQQETCGACPTPVDKGAPDVVLWGFFAVAVLCGCLALWFFVGQPTREVPKVADTRRSVVADAGAVATSLAAAPSGPRRRSVAKRAYIVSVNDGPTWAPR